MIDACWALASRRGGHFDRTLLIGATVPQAVAWMGGTAAGVAVGSDIGDPNRLGLDMVFPVLFLALLLGELRGGGWLAIAAASLAALIALVLLPVVPRAYR